MNALKKFRKVYLLKKNQKNIKKIEYIEQKKNRLFKNNPKY